MITYGDALRTQRRIIQCLSTPTPPPPPPLFQLPNGNQTICTYVRHLEPSTANTERRYLARSTMRTFCESSKLERAFAHDREWRKRLKLNSKFRLGFRQCRVPWSSTHKSSVSACKFIWLGGRESVLSISIYHQEKKKNNNKFVTSAVTQRTRECDKLVS